MEETEQLVERMPLRRFLIQAVEAEVDLQIITMTIIIVEVLAAAESSLLVCTLRPSS